MLPVWLLWALRGLVVIVFGLLLYFLVTSRRVRGSLPERMDPSSEAFGPNGAGGRLGNPHSVGLPGMPGLPSTSHMMSHNHWVQQPEADQDRGGRETGTRASHWMDLSQEFSRGDADSEEDRKEPD